MKAHNGRSSLKYFPGDDKAYQYIEEPPAGVEWKNFEIISHPATIHNARGREDELTLDKGGFQFINSPSVEREFDDEECIKAQYYPEVEGLLKKATSAKRVVIFDHTLRRKLAEGTTDKPGNRGPELMVYIDQTPSASVERVKHHLPAEADRLLGSRVRLINVWRPIHHPVAHFPLADLIPIDFIYPTRRGETYGVRHNPQQKWYYLRDQAPDEVTLIKCYDPDETLARLMPHTAFEDETSPKDTPHRESIEVRALLQSRVLDGHDRPRS
ncbi:uncharacterized protein BXZ73DRAFT_87881 [Epithele typhae]|uniref:uncharacterized protein n=1 Tax=Epithele typhae TaxID=378194 RepID=UPI0020079F0D|nr:uncharacterized protein BXZ73DRAFT_87881 [Epithele typhae]KAH9942228.1 hypothetical protein BXZ73DRAFT_87881 [Epithele typhae]